MVYLLKKAIFNGLIDGLPIDGLPIDGNITMENHHFQWVNPL